MMIKMILIIRENLFQKSEKIQHLGALRARLQAGGPLALLDFGIQAVWLMQGRLDNG